MKTIKTTLIAALLLFTVNAALAQDKYEYSTLISNSALNTISIITASELKTIKIAKGETEMQALLKEVNRMNKEENWEVYNNSTIVNSSNIYAHYFYLRKKVS
ncbi:MAG: hypothetical protein AB7G44_15155 [Bacteroidia bacterium]